MHPVSIITINYNNASGLEKTIQSVSSQTVHDLEFIVIDGGSSDDSTEVIRKYSSCITFWTSEPDSGVYNAMNKGILRATGKYLLFLNSGDHFDAQDALRRLMDASDDHDIVYGDLIVQEPTGRWRKAYPPILTFGYFRRESLPHPCTLIKRALFRNNLYREDFRISSDWAFFVNEICLRGAKYKHIDYPISVFSTDGLSSAPSNRQLISREKGIVFDENYSAFMPDYVKLEACEKAIRDQWRRSVRGRLSTHLATIRKALRF